jgi:tetratricopeptide (TPR) repeat protein
VRVLSSKEKLIASAQKSLEKGQVAKAIKDYQKLVELDPRDMRTRQKLAELLSRGAMNAEAFEQYGTVARNYADNGFFLKAIAVYKQMQKLDPEQVSVYQRLAELNAKQGLVGNALAEYRNLAAIYEKKKMLPEAIGVLQKMVELDPDNLNMRAKVTESYLQAGLREKSRESLAEMLGYLRQQGDWGKVARLCEMFAPRFADDLGLRIALAEATVHLGDSDKGIHLLQGLLKHHPDNADILHALAAGYRQRRDFENERLTYHHLLTSAPDSLDLRERYVRACLDAGDHSRALAELEERREAFLAAGRMPVWQEFAARLRRAFPGDAEPAPPAGSVAAASEAAARVEEAPAESPPASAFPSQPPVAPLPAEEAFEGAEEIPLEFLEAAVDLGAEETEPAVEPVAGATAEEPAATAEPVEAPLFVEEAAAPPELELELELDLDLDLEDPALAVEASAAEIPPPVSGMELATEVEPEQVYREAFPEPPATAEPVAEPEELEELEELVDLEEVEPIEELEEAEELEELEEAAPAARAPGPGGIAEEGDLLDLGLEEILAPEASAAPGPYLRAELEEAEFYLQQGLLDDAERVCRALLVARPDCDPARRKLDEIGQRRRQAPATAEREEEFFDLAAEILDEGMLRATEGMPGLQEADRFRIDGIFSEFKKGIESQIDVEDTETHYNLGIAYKEMGLLDDAVAEFDRALNNPSRVIDCLTLKGICLAEKGSFEQAEQAFRAGLAHPGVSSDERLSLNYEMGLLFEAWSRPRQALECFQQVADADLFFRNVGDKVRELRSLLGLPAAADAAGPGGKGSKDRVSYV